MDERQLRNVIEAALLAADQALSLDKLMEVLAGVGEAPERAVVRKAIEALADEYEGRGIEVKEVASGYRIQVRRSMTDFLQPLWEERAPRYTRALLETLALVAYRQPVTRAEIEEVRGVSVSTNIVRTLMERGWIRVVGYRDVPGRPSMLGTTREFLDYFGLRKLEDLPPLAAIRDDDPAARPQADLVDALRVLGTHDAPVSAELGPAEGSSEDRSSGEGPAETVPADEALRGHASADDGRDQAGPVQDQPAQEA